jgi:hypothetical protein
MSHVTKFITEAGTLYFKMPPPPLCPSRELKPNILRVTQVLHSGSGDHRCARETPSQGMGCFRATLMDNTIIKTR